jgi:outer membrane protein assembly factor BamD (BamD/ComL family)
MKTLRYVVLLALVAGLAGCGSASKDMEKIKSIESTVFKDASGMNKEQAAQLVVLYDAFAKDWPKDSAAATCLYKAAEMSINLNKGNDAIGYFDRVIKEYPEYSRVPEAYFLKGFVYEISLMNLTKAREAYAEFLQKYPKHELSDDAQISMENLGKSPEQVLMEAQKKIEQAKIDSLAAVK